MTRLILVIAKPETLKETVLELLNGGCEHIREVQRKVFLKPDNWKTAPLIWERVENV